MTQTEFIEERTDSFTETDEGTKFSYNENEKDEIKFQNLPNKLNARYSFEREETSLKEEVSDESTDNERGGVNLQSKNLKLFKAEQKWRGYITYINENSFKARLKDITKGGTDEEAWFSFKEITEEERNNLEIGKSFYLSLGYSEYLGRVEKVMRLHFQKTSDWELGLIDEVDNKIKEYIDLLDD